MRKKPEWIKLKIKGSKNQDGVEKVLKTMRLNTVCQAANCPNKMECYEMRTATFMIMGNVCTRNCKFCNVETKRPAALDSEEPLHVAEAVKTLGLKHAVLTSPDRDDLEDEGAGHFRDCIRKIRELNENTTVEVLIPDFHASHKLLDIVLDEKPEVLNHNMETVKELHKEICPQSNYENSIEVLRYAKEKGLVTKSGIMVGLGETFDQVVGLMKDLREIDCDMLTIGQYLQPSTKHMEVVEYITPDTFKEYKRIGLELGFKELNPLHL